MGSFGLLGGGSVRRASSISASWPRHTSVNAQESSLSVS